MLRANNEASEGIGVIGGCRLLLFSTLFHHCSQFCLSCGELALLVVAVGKNPGNEIYVLLQCSVGPCTLLFSRGSTKSLLFLFPRQAGFHRFGALNSL